MLTDTTRTYPGMHVKHSEVGASDDITHALLVFWVPLETLQGNRPGSRQSEHEDQSAESRK
jgi:hypothetical protein